VTTYRRIEINAFRRRVTIVSAVSGEWSRDVVEAQPEHAEDGVSLNDSDSCEPIEPDSPEGQLLLAEAVRSLERRLSPEARAALCSGAAIPPASSRPTARRKLQSLCRFIYPQALRFIRKEK